MKTRRPEACPMCGSGKVVKCGFRVTKEHGKRQRYMCQECASTFYGEDVV